MHGGRSRGPRTQAGKERARRDVIKHGEYTKEAKAKHKQVMDLIKTSKDTLSSVCCLKRPYLFSNSRAFS
jgi:hypothetical protein